jgi:hypothetical protein
MCSLSSALCTCQHFVVNLGLQPIFIRIAFAALGVAVVLSLSGCDAWTRTQGTIRDTSGKPIQGALVTIKIGSESRNFQSSEEGRYVAQMWQPPFKQDVALTVSKPGFITSEKKLKGPGTYNDFDVILQPAPQQPPTTPESIAKAIFPNAPNKVQSIDCFRSLPPEISLYAVVQKCGGPDEEVGSGIYIFVWHMPDGSSVSIGTPYLDKIGDVRITDTSGKTSSLRHKK